MKNHQFIAMIGALAHLISFSGIDLELTSATLLLYASMAAWRGRSEC